MLSRSINSNPKESWPCGHLRRIATLAIVCLLAAGIPVQGQTADHDNQVERSMAFVERTIEATELLNSDHVEQALAVFQELLASYGDLDEDGFVSMATGDCLFKLGRHAEAQAAYESALASHPELVERIDERLTELELAGTVTDKLLEDLRRTANTPDDKRFAAAWYLARGLQKRAHDLLNEAIDAFTQATSPGSPIPGRTIRTFHTAHVEEVVLQISLLIEQLENRWSKMGRSMDDCASTEGDRRVDAIAIQNQRSEWTITQPDGRQIAFKVQKDDDGPCRITADGKQVTLTEIQTALIRQHQDRINTILIEALTTQTP